MLKRRIARVRGGSFLPLLPVTLLLAGCGSIGSTGHVNTTGLVLRAARTSTDTGTTNQLSAMFASGTPAGVIWSIVDGQNDPSIGQGSIDANGLYTPPPLLSRDTVNVEVKASFENDPAKSATYVLTVTPGFVQSLTPENASLAPGGSIRLTGEIAEVNSGSVHWSLESVANGGADAKDQLGRQYGSITGTQCRHSSQAYTTCAATYTAPASPPGSAASIYVVASFPGNSRSIASSHVLLNGANFNNSPLENQSAQTDYVEMGSSGGNANDYDSSQNSQGDQYVNDCCGGTLGALVQDRRSNLYILSNNHVLAESDQARPGDTIIQPALVDLNCNPQAGRTVGSLRYVVPLQDPQTNVDAALAAATPAVDPSGGILDLGAPLKGRLSSAAPAGGLGEALTASQLDHLRIAKSGRTTGLTCGAVNTIDLSVQVDYYYDCAETKPSYTKTYIDQIGIPGIGFADSGDSGALVLDASNAQPIGLLFASGGDNNNHGFSVANPIQDVLSELGQRSQVEGQQLQIVGGAPHPITCSNYDQDAAAGVSPALHPAQAAEAKSTADAAAATLIRPDNGILSVGVGKSLDAPEEPAVVVYVNKNKPVIAVPKIMSGLRTVVIATEDAGAGAVVPVDRPQGIHLPAGVLRAAVQVQQQYAPKLMSDPAFFGVGVTQSYDNPAEAALLVLVDVRKTPQSMPDLVGGLRVRYLRINRLHVTRSRSASRARPTSCELRAAGPRK